ncbi:ATP-binding cassette domain-containing protein, partial [Candidatus Kapabacteria bacterium]|nr:ATP-binding cassette domain-containing protein [Candidatus Kapabacteria bacterium]
MLKIAFENVCKSFGDTLVLKDISFQIIEKEFLVLLGPSGCGKSTLLRMVSGLEDVSSGKLLIDNTDVKNIEPHKRKIGMVFQNYALYPHM